MTTTSITSCCENLLNGKLDIRMIHSSSVGKRKVTVPFQPVTKHYHNATRVEPPAMQRALLKDFFSVNCFRDGGTHLVRTILGFYATIV